MSAFRLLQIVKRQRTIRVVVVVGETRKD